MSKIVEIRIHCDNEASQYYFDRCDQFVDSLVDHGDKTGDVQGISLCTKDAEFCHHAGENS